MSVKMDKTIEASGTKLNIHAEFYTSAKNVVEDCKAREVRHNSYDIADEDINERWYGVKNYDEALKLLEDGYQPTVDSLKSALKVTPKEGPRFSFDNEIQGFYPIVPLALKGIPNNMLNMTMKPIKAKVCDVYYDMTANSGYDPEDFLKAGRLLLGAIISLEKQGYRFNLYAVQSYYDVWDYAEIPNTRAVDFLCVKVKSSDKPIDLKRISFPLTHSAFFRVIGFDWQGKSPVTRYIGSGRGTALGHEFSMDKCQKIAKEAFGNNVFYVPCAKLISGNYNEQKLKEVFTNAEPTKKAGK